MTALASRLVTAKFPAAPAGGTLGPGNYIEFRLSQPAWNLTTGEEVPMLLQGPIDPVTGAMGFWDTTVGTPQAGVRLVCNDDPDLSPQGTVWTATPYVENMPGTPIPLVVSIGDTDPVFLATLARPVNSSVSYGVQFDDGTTTLPNVTRVTVSNGSLSGTGNHAIVGTGGGGGGGSGTVTSVAQTVPPEFAVGGSPITTAGTLAITKANQAANQVWAGPTTGAAAAPAFRALVAADLPAATTGAQGAAVLATPSSDVTAGHVVQASDARLSDARPPSTPTTKGDLVGFSTVPARVPAGSNGQQLIADSTQALGLRWDAIVKEFSWTATGYGYFQAGTAMTLDQAVTPNGTFAYDRAVAGALGTFSSVSLPVTLAAGDVLRVNCSALANSYGALVLKRVA